MKKKSQHEQSGEKFKWLQIEILVVFAVIIMIVIFFLDYIILINSKRAMEKNASNLISANSRQIQLNINSYLERMETIPTLLFSDESYYLYDATDETVEEYQKVKMEESIQERIVDIGLMENYSDFGIVYSNEDTVGWISHGTEDIFPEGGMYETFSGYVSDNKKADGWCFDVNGCTDRIYYIKRLNPNAVLESATYTRELSQVFVYPEELEGMTIRLVDENDEIIYSSDDTEIGQALPSEISDELMKSGDDKSGAPGEYDKSIISAKYIINTNECSNGWKVICSVPTEIILRDNNSMRSFILKVSLGVAVFFVLAGLALILKIYRPMGDVVESLQKSAEFDKLSGVMNKAAFQDEVEVKLSAKNENDISILVMIDVDNFKQVNDKLGHSHGDQVIIRTGEILKKVFNADTIIGRLGGDEFASYSEVKISDNETDEKEYRESREGMIAIAREQLVKLRTEFDREFKEEKSKCSISLSTGVYITDKYSGAKENFKLIYDKADKALYNSKRTGKSKDTVYEEE